MRPRPVAATTLGSSARRKGSSRARGGQARRCALLRSRIPGFSGFLCTWGFARDLSESPVLPASSTLELSFFATQLKYHFPGNLTAFCSRSKLAAGFFHTSQRVSFSCSSCYSRALVGAFCLAFSAVSQGLARDHNNS